MHLLQIIIPFFIAGIGTCFAGILLDHVQHWVVFEKIDEFFLLLPALLGLKGNLQMTLASRFSTHSHLGHLQTQDDLLGLTCANLSLNQCLSIVISLSASILVTAIEWLTVNNSSIDLQRTLIVATTALLTSSVTSFLLDIVMILVVQFAAHYNLNPDNVATPLAASLGDITALLLCSHLASLLYAAKPHYAFYWITFGVIIFYLCMVPFWVLITRRNPHTNNVISKPEHWYPLMTAMSISTVGGITLKLAVLNSADIALFQPVICGVGGNLVAVQASRLASNLQLYCRPSELPLGERVCVNPCNLLFSQREGYRSTRLLIYIVIPGQIFFYFTCVLLNGDKKGPSIYFLILYLAGSQILVIVLLYLAYVLTYWMWRYGVDPDSCTIPYLTSMSDAIGSVIITFVCFIANPAQSHEGHTRP